MALCAPAPAPRALWVWDGASIRRSPAQRKALFEFLDVPRGDRDRPIRVLFFDAGSRADLGDAQEARSVREFVRAAHRRGVRVDYLCGDARWALPEEHDAALGLLDAALAYNAASAPDERFDGFQYDVEPYLLKSWPAKETISAYLALLDKASKRIRLSKARLRLGAAIPAWFDAADLGGLHRSVIDRVDYVALMDYVDTTPRFVDGARGEVEYASAKGKKVWAGAETQELRDEPHATFFAKGAAAMEEAFASATTHFGNSRGFAGVAIHHYASYPNLRP